MSKTLRIAGNPELDPTLPKVEIEAGQGQLLPVLQLPGAFAIAQKNLKDNAGVDCNLLHALDLSSMDALQACSAALRAALLTHQPKITLEKAASLVTMQETSA